MIKLLQDLEAITGTNEQFLLGKWLKDARSLGETDQEKRFYEWNARTIITIWQPWKEGALRDYAGKAWNGMFSSYYLPRWKLRVEFLHRSLDTGKPFDPEAYDRAVRGIDFAWTHSNEEYPAEPTGDVIEAASRIQAEYGHYFSDERQ